ncbi:uncharacterized protein KD926_001611 [Aspergillus affinis]|uniref:uncharacterized protein n=1 Tax=Aspergillus affinis TaxID=1070780 RepID=UPI0022FE5332|nr:uncharacterized protein KD926_001611 [Aspergillus affinis]KAI9036657.1 hypothetical protein KD926_001611 [Aspergillus affinis]
MSIALDCWTSPFKHAFMAITGYFLDQEWEYREVLLGFEPISGSHTGVNLGDIVLQILQKHQIADRVLAVTTDNASNNKTLIAAVNDSIKKLQIETDSTIVQVPCLAHIIQLSLVNLLGKIKASPKNDNAETEWSDDRVRLLRTRQQKHEIADTLNKYDELTKYLQSGSIRIFWKDHQREFPILASIARDIMSILATGAGVERLFNFAQDVCYYCRGSLNLETVRDIMLYMYYKIAVSAEALDVQTHVFEAISDNEEDVEIRLDILAAISITQAILDVPPLSAVAAGKRPAVTSDDKENSNTDKFADPDENRALPLSNFPDTQHRVSEP